MNLNASSICGYNKSVALGCIDNISLIISSKKITYETIYNNKAENITTALTEWLS